jgi:UDP-GlcNAc:undecaprenyl-phosphate GlcNAc-1-phosphate transferase
MLTLLTAAAVTYLLTPLARWVSEKFGAMHDPRDRDVHVVRTPLLGGLAMYGGLLVALLLAGRFGYLSQALGGPRTSSGILLAGGLLVAVGVVDDRWGMSAISKLAAQVAAGGILVWSGTELSWIPSPYGNVIVLSSNQGLVLTILVVAMTINAVNFIDGLDGLAAGIVAISALAYFSYSYTLLKVTNDSTQSLPALMSAILAGMCLGFLPHNFYPARIFMGDTGAMLLGLLLAYGPISSTATLDPSILVAYGKTHVVDRFPTILPLLLPVAIFLIPYGDLLLAVVRRTRAGQSPFTADMKHLHHRLMNFGHSQRKSVLIMYLWAALFAGAVVALSIIRTKLMILAGATLLGMLTLLLVTVPRLQPRRPVRRPARNGDAAAAPGQPVTRASSQPVTHAPGTGSPQAAGQPLHAAGQPVPHPPHAPGSAAANPGAPTGSSRQP